MNTQFLFWITHDRFFGIWFRLAEEMSRSMKGLNILLKILVFRFQCSKVPIFLFDFIIFWFLFKFCSIVHDSYVTHYFAFTFYEPFRQWLGWQFTDGPKFRNIFDDSFSKSIISPKYNDVRKLAFWTRRALEERENPKSMQLWLQQ